MRTVVVDADVVEPAAVSALLKQLRGIGSVSTVDVRRILVGHVELSVRGRLTAPALVLALSRDTSGLVTVSGVEATGDLVRMRARLKEGSPVPLAAPLAPGILPPSSPSSPSAGKVGPP